MRGRIFRLVAAGALMSLAVASAASAGTITYTYDAQGRLVSAAYSDGTTICYFYDSAGNRTAYKVGTAVCPAPGHGSGAAWGQFTWGSVNWGPSS